MIGRMCTIMSMQRIGRVFLARTTAAGCRHVVPQTRWFSDGGEKEESKGDGAKSSPKDPFQVADSRSKGQSGAEAGNEKMITGGTSAGFSPDTRSPAKQRFDPNGKNFKFETKPREYTGLSADEVQLPHEKDVQKAIADFTKERRVRRDLGFSPGQLFEDPASIPRQERWKTFRPNRLVVTGKELHPLNAWTLSKFLSPSGKILPRRQTGLSAKKQRKLAKVVKASRHLGLLGYTTQYNPDVEDGRRFAPFKVRLDEDFPMDDEVEEETEGSDSTTEVAPATDEKMGDTGDAARTPRQS